jgi:hypothetical protein
MELKLHFPIHQGHATIFDGKPYHGFSNICVRFEVFTAVAMKNGIFWKLRCMALVRTDVLEELTASIITLYFFTACFGC